MTTSTATTGTKKVTIKRTTDGYGDTVYVALLSQSYNNGIELVERFIESKKFTTESRAKNWAKKQL